MQKSNVTLNRSTIMLFKKDLSANLAFLSVSPPGGALKFQAGQITKLNKYVVIFSAFFYRHIFIVWILLLRTLVSSLR